jgi:outer membrane lipoprotein-sorting protein
MKEIQEIASLARLRCLGWKAIIFAAGLALLLLGASCQIKRTVRMEVPAKILVAQSATLDQLMSQLDAYSSQIGSLTAASMKVTFTAGKQDSGVLQEYRSAPGYLLLARPDLIRMVVQNPLTKTAVLDLASRGDEFSVWIPRDNKLYSGHNSAKELAVKGETQGMAFTARPAHIFEAILPYKMELSVPDIYIAMEEEQDAITKYYVLNLYRLEVDHILVPLRKLWIDRAEMAVARQLIYNQEGKVVGDIVYSAFKRVQNYFLPLKIKIDRPLDGYSLDLEVKEWQINSDLPVSAFILTAPPGAQHIQLSETGRSQDP